MQSVTSPTGIVCPGSSLSDPTNVRANVGVTTRLPPGEPGVAVRLPATGVPDEVRNPQRDAEHERDCDGSRPEVHCSAPPGARISECKRRSCPRPRPPRL